MQPNLTYKTRDINVELSPTTEYLYEKYSHDNGHHQMLFSPDLSVKWYVTPRLRLSMGGSASVEPLDASRFYRSLILQDFQYINRGYAGYRHSHTQAIRGGINYSDALKALHTILTVSRSFSTSPYTPTRQFVGDYIILSAIEQESKSDSWQANLIASKGINLWNGVVNLRALYLNSDASMKIQSMVYSQKIDSWKQDLSVIIPVSPFSIDLRGEYYRNEITSGNYKDFFLADIKASYKSKRLDLTLSLNNLLNRDTYSYVITSDLTSSTSTNHIRGRELLLTAYYKL